MDSPAIVHSSIRSALEARGYSYSTMRLGAYSYNVWTAPNGWTWMWHNFRKYPFTPQTTAEISWDKKRAYDFASLHSVTIPATILTDSRDEAVTFLEKYQRVIVKPLSGSGSRGVSLDITTPESLQQVIPENEKVLVQQQFIGEELRFTFLDGRVVSVIYRQTPRVIGDGVSSLQELIDRENNVRRTVVFPLLQYPQLDAQIINFDAFDLSSIPLQGQVIELSRSTMIKRGASFYGVTNAVHRSYIEIAEKLAKALSATYIAVDIMVKDFTIPATDDNYTFIEFNTSPSPAPYSSLRAGDTPPVLNMLADLFDRAADGYKA